MNTNNDQSHDLQFNRPSIQDLVFSINPEFTSENDQKQEYQIMVSASNPKYDSQVEKKVSKVTLTVTNKKKLDKKENLPFILRVTMNADFLVSESISDDDVKQLLKVNGATLLMSYVRPLISYITSQTSIGTQDIPFIDFTKSQSSN